MIFCDVCEAQLWGGPNTAAPEQVFLCASCDREVQDGADEDPWGKNSPEPELAWEDRNFCGREF
jgi:hypothetical protein